MAGGQNTVAPDLDHQIRQGAQGGGKMLAQAAFGGLGGGSQQQRSDGAADGGEKEHLIPGPGTLALLAVIADQTDPLRPIHQRHHQRGAHADTFQKAAFARPRRQISHIAHRNDFAGGEGTEPKRILGWTYILHRGFKRPHAGCHPFMAVELCAIGAAKKHKRAVKVAGKAEPFQHLLQAIVDLCALKAEQLVHQLDDKQLDPRRTRLQEVR